MLSFLKRLSIPVSLVGLWLFWLIVLVTIWRLLPNFLTEIALLTLVAVSFWGSLKKKMMVALFCSIVFLNIFLNYLVVQQNLGLYLSTIIFGMGLILIGLIYESNQYPLTWKEGILKWVLIALVISESYGFFSYWSISLFNRGLLVVFFFYMIWFYLEQSDGSTKSLIGHFIFSLLIAILVLGGIIWANYPQLLTF